MATVKQIRKQKGLTETQLANRARVGRSTIRRMESGGKVTYATFSAVARALGVSPNALDGVNILNREFKRDMS